MDTVLSVHFEENLDKDLDKLDTVFGITLQKYRQFSECITEKITEEVYNFETIQQRHRSHSYMREAYIFCNFMLKMSNSEAH